MGGYVYMLASKRGGTIYIGVTSDLSQRVFDHKQRINKKSFTSTYGAVRLVWYEEHDDITDAIQREKSLKRWRRQWSEERTATPVKRQRFGVSSDERPEP